MGDTHSYIDEELRAPELTTREKKLRLLFAREYVACGRDEYHAALRVGFDKAFAAAFGDQFMNEGFTLKLIDEVMEEPIGKNEETRMKNRTIRQLMVHAKTANKPANQVGALVQISKILKMELAAGEENNDRLGGVMEVPAMTTPEEWTAMAAPEQAQLKETVRE